jgi:predicted dehydrogenase
MNVAIVGCGYVAEFYGKTLGNYPALKLVGAYDTNAENLRKFSHRWSTKAYPTLGDLLADPGVEMIFNLTNPRSHYEVTSQSLQARKHVYSEKPLAMDSNAAEELVDLAKRQGVYLSAAPCSMLGETAQTVWKALKEGVVGRVRLVYANFDDGMIAPKMSPWLWRNESDVPWPAKDEFEVGCTFEHAGYVLSWLAAFFGPAQNITAFASCQIPDKGIAVDRMAPDFTVGCIEYSEGLVARVTCGLVAPKDKSLTIVGDDGVLFVGNLRNDAAPVYVRRSRLTRMQSRIARRTEWLQHWLEARIAWPGAEIFFQRQCPLARKPRGRFVDPSKPVDFCRGPAEMDEAIRENRACRLPAELGLQITELIETLQYPERFGGSRKIKSTFDPIQPLHWSN